MKQAMINYTQNDKCDEFYTPRYGVIPLLKYIPKHVKNIWCPCDTEESNIVKVLKEAGYNVTCSHISEGIDFLDQNLTGKAYDMIITNPPYSNKDDFIQRCYDLGMPFALLLPLTTLEGTRRGDMFRKYGINTIVFDKRIDFQDEEEKKEYNKYVREHNKKAKEFNKNNPEEEQLELLKPKGSTWFNTSWFMWNGIGHGIDKMYFEKLIK